MDKASFLTLKGLSHEMDLTFEDVHGLNMGRDQFLNFLGAPMIL